MWALVIGGERDGQASYDIKIVVKGSCIPARNVGREPFVWCALMDARFICALQNLGWIYCISLKMGVRIGRYLDVMVSISSFIILAVEIA
jgi:hypothetical protein